MLRTVAREDVRQLGNRWGIINTLGGATAIDLQAPEHFRHLVVLSQVSESHGQGGRFDPVMLS